MTRTASAAWVLGWGLAATASLLVAGVVAAAPQGNPAPSARPPAAAGQEGLFTLPGKLPEIPGRVPQFAYDVAPEQERFYLCVPPNYRGREPFGLIAFVNAGDQMDLPRDWKPVLAKHRLLYVAPQNVGNGQAVSRRGGVTVVAICKLMELYKIDPRRVYVAGVSGGAKVACEIAFFHPELVRGALPMCGVVFPAPHGVNVFDCDPKLVEKARTGVGFALITGSKDFNHAGILARYRESFLPQEYRAKLFDVPGLGHQVARAQTLSSALEWLDRGAAPAGKADQPAKPENRGQRPKRPSEPEHVWAGNAA